MVRASKPNIPNKSTGDLHYASEVNAVDTAIDATIDDYVSQTETSDQNVASNIIFASGKRASDAAKLEGSTKAQVQDHAPKSHTHVEADITNLDHDAQKIKGKTVDDSAIGNDKILVYKTAGDKIVYEAKPVGVGEEIAGEYSGKSPIVVPHGLSAKPSWVCVTPKALQPYVVSYNSSATNITIYHNAAGSLTVTIKAGI